MLGLVLQIIPEEVPAAEELLSLICDIEPVPRKDVEFILFARKDVEPVDSRRLVEKLRAKFPRAKHVECWDFATGWPHGSNTMWFSLIRQMFHMWRMDEVACDGFLSFETDCIPMRTNWISLLAETWEKAKAQGKEATGHFHGGEGCPTHMNGNAIFATRFWENHQDMVGCHGMQPWDVAYAPVILRVAADTDRINQWYRLQAFTEKDWELLSKTPCALFHGIKVPDGRRIAREELVTKPWQITQHPTPETVTRTLPSRSKPFKTKSRSSSKKLQHSKPK